ncbi:IPT/TIG domain-containing protein [bacterium]|nr:IPT/TIG domain-containing protein [bacterium]
MTRRILMELRHLFDIVLLAMLLFLIDCEGIVDQGDEAVTVPVITNINPFAGYPGEELTITGSNFNPVFSLNQIELTDTSVFYLETVQPTSGDANSLTITRPNISGIDDTIHAWLSVRNLEDPEQKKSDSIAIDLLPIFDIITFDSLPKAKGGLAFDASGNLYVGGQDPGDIYKLTPAGEQTYFGHTQSGGGEMTIGPDGDLYMCNFWGELGTSRIPASGGNGEIFVTSDEAPQPFCLDWDSDENFYIGSAGGAIYRRLAISGAIEKIFGDGSWGMPMRIYQNEIYWFNKGGEAGTNGLFKAAIPVVNDTIPANSVITVLATDDYNPSGLAIDGTGNVYLMTGWVDYNDRSLPGDLVRITPGGIVEVVYELPTQNPNKAAWYDNKIYMTAGELGNQVYVLHLGEEYGNGAVPAYGW